MKQPPSAEAQRQNAHQQQPSGSQHQSNQPTSAQQSASQPSSNQHASGQHHAHHHHHQRRPNIAITPDSTPVTAENPFVKYDLKAAYADAVFRAGGLPFIVPYSNDKSVINSYLDRVSGLLVTGGAFDISPELYGEQAKDGMGQTKPLRTSFEMALLRGALSRRMPVLGICGGMQLLNVAFGGTLIQDIGREVANTRGHEQPHDRTQPHHPVDVRDNTALAQAVGRGQLFVNSTHHQAVKTIGAGLLISASAPDGVIEAIEAKDGWAVGVQWHPELMCDSVPANLGIYRAFITKARGRRH